MSRAKFHLLTQRRATSTFLNPRLYPVISTLAPPKICGSACASNKPTSMLMRRTTVFGRSKPLSPARSTLAYSAAGHAFGYPDGAYRSVADVVGPDLRAGRFPGGSPVSTGSSEIRPYLCGNLQLVAPQ